MNLEEIAGLTAGFTGADLANLVNEAAIVATRRDGDDVTTADFTAAVERIVAGTERRTMVMNADERRRVAVHEIGHALVAAALPAADPVQKVSIIPRSIGALGYTLQRPTEDRFLIIKEELRQRMAVLMAGRAAEILTFSEGSTGAADDLAKVTDVARECVTCYGMGEVLGPVALEEQPMSWIGDGEGFGVRSSDHSEATAREIGLAVRQMVSGAHDRACEILAERRVDLDAGAALLLEKETLTPDDFPPIQRVANNQKVGTNAK